MTRKRIAILVAAAAGVVAIVVGIVSCGSPSHHHHATCWKPSYAAHPTAPWARHFSLTHRHGRGPRGIDICDAKK